MNSKLTLADNSDDLLSQIETGLLIRDVAKQYNVTRAAVSNALRRADPARYKQALEIGMQARLEDALQAQHDANEPVSIARAREIFKSTAWLAERTQPHIYGSKQTLVHQGDADKPVFVVNIPQQRNVIDVDVEDV
jgi:hypothetical protein